MQKKLAFALVGRRIVCVALAGAMLACGVVAFAQSPAVSVESKAGRITVHVREAADRSAVLEAVCQHIQARCDGLEATVGMPIQPTTITDTWPGVVRKLLEGSGLNHIALSPAGKAPARLLVSARPSGPAPMAPEEKRAAQDRRDGENRVAGERGPAFQAGRKDEADPAHERERDAADAGPAGGNSSSPRSDPGSSGTTGSSSTPYAGSPVPFVPPPGTVASPFPGPEGTPIVMPKDNTPPGQAPNPFLDPFGNPIPPPPPGSPVGSPFLGPDGKPILTTPLPPGQTPNPFVTGTPPK